MGKLIDLQNANYEELENKLFDDMANLQELVNGQITILSSVTDEGSILIDEDNNVTAYKTSEKLNEVIKELTALKNEAELIEKAEDLLNE
ncbi:hypothetical protein [Melissococcus sp. OM08-11BH]|uniref:hypothetical protein n=1 Tax=Melissococcus sp. OM08-11BH TaxID=2293110 RepID=UPI000E4A014D|nr:hypothetical protein [Melissococcus sp. OM08-11BH]RGI31860.1 hypothetical protein DXC12_00730 [Melissococcus sp. OM08-11BH]